jgi:hypothetical protein
MALFFPVNINDSYTCLSHRLLSQEKNHFSQDEHSEFDAASIHRKKSVDSHHLVKTYLLPYALLWWVSIGIVFLSYRYYKRIGPVEKKIK